MSNPEFKLSSKPKIEVCSTKDIEKQFGLDESAKDPAGSREGIHDIEKLMGHVIDLVEFMNSEPMKEMKIKNNDEFERVIIFKYQNDIPYRIISLLFENQEKFLPELIDMFEILLKIKSGKADCKTEYEKFGESKNEEYIYPKFGGKEKFYQFCYDEQQKKNKQK
jgi:hypothetical protein